MTARCGVMSMCHPPLGDRDRHHATPALDENLLEVEIVGDTAGDLSIARIDVATAAITVATILAAVPPCIWP